MIINLLILALAFAEKNYTNLIQTLQANIKTPQYRHRSYQNLAYLSDSYGPRMWGSPQLQKAIRSVRNMAEKDGFQNIKLEPVENFTKWVRGQQSLTLHSPRPVPTPLTIIGLGWSASGQIYLNRDVQADAIVVQSFQQLQKVKSQVAGKIVVFNQPWMGYSKSVAYRVEGASKAAKYGAKAALVRSVTPYSIESVHAGAMVYDQSYPKIPIAAIAVQDAQMFKRMQNRNQTINLHLILKNQLVKNCHSSNLVFQVVGSTQPQKILLMGGHIDSWDTGSQTGANDDGGGFFTVYQALRLIKGLGYRPKRTLRFIAWSGQEFGDARRGAAQYAQLHKQQLKNHIMAFQSDQGSTQLKGFGISGSDQQINLVKEIGSKYFQPINASLITNEGVMADTSPLYQKGIPVIRNLVQDTKDGYFYFTYHHSAGDSITMMDGDEMDSNVLGMAALFYILADLQTTI